MAKQFAPEVNQDQRKVLLEDNAFKVEQTEFLRPLTTEELDLRRETLAENCIQYSELEDSKKIAMEGFKMQMDPINKANKILLSEIKTRQAKFEGLVYHIANHDTGMMEIYDSNGELISSRRLRPEEKQQTIFPLRKAQ